MDGNCSESVEIQHTPEIQRNNSKQRGYETKYEIGSGSHFLYTGTWAPGVPFRDSSTPSGNEFTMDLTAASLAKSGSI